MRLITISFCALLIFLHFSTSSAALDRTLADVVVVTPSTSSKCGNSLLYNEGSKKGLVKGLANSTVVTNLTFCPSLNGSQSCCAAEEINKASTVLSQVSAEVEASLKKIDLAYASSRSFLNNLTANFKELGEIYVRSEKAIAEALKDADSSIIKSFVSPNLTNLLNLIRIPPNLIAFNDRIHQLNVTIDNKDLLGSYLGAFRNISNAIDADFPLYQVNRKKCFDHLMDTYSRFYCLACNPNTTDFFYVDETLKQRLRIHTNSCVTLMNECYDYVNYNEVISGFQHSEQLNDTVNSTNNLLVLFRQYDSTVNSTLNELKNAGTDKTKIDTIVSSALNKSASISYQIDNVTEWGRAMNRDFKYSVVPSNCNSTVCVTICERFYNEFGVNLVLALENPTDRIEKILPGISNSNGVNYTIDGVVLEKIVSGLESLNSTEVNVNPANVNGGSSSGDKTGNYAGKLVIGTILLAMIAIIN